MVMYRFVNELTDSQCDDLVELYRSEWWSSSRTRENVDRVIAGSDYIFGIADEDDRLVAFARVLTDHIYIAYLFDVIVSEEHRNKGLGSRLLSWISTHPELLHVHRIELCCKQELENYYKRFGFQSVTGRMALVRPNSDIHPEVYAAKCS